MRRVRLVVGVYVDMDGRPRALIGEEDGEATPTTFPRDTEPATVASVVGQLVQARLEKELPE